MPMFRENKIESNIYAQAKVRRIENEDKLSHYKYMKV